MRMSTNIAVYEPPAILQLVTQAYASLLLIAFALTRPRCSSPSYFARHLIA
jgi:hypothetical protein